MLFDNFSRAYGSIVVRRELVRFKSIRVKPQNSNLSHQVDHSQLCSVYSLILSM